MYTWKFGLSSNVMLAEPRCTETDLKSPTFVPIFEGQSDPLRAQAWPPSLAETNRSIVLIEIYLELIHTKLLCDLSCIV